MENSVIYSTARELAQKVKQEKPFCGGLEAAVIIGDKGTYLGVTGVGVAQGSIVDIPAGVTAYLNMRNSGGRNAQGLAVIKLEDMSFVKPSADAMELMFRTSKDNDGCLVCLGENESRLLSALRLGADGDSMIDGFDFDEEPAGTPAAGGGKPASGADTTANVISGVAVDESNPFYEKSQDVAPPETTLSVMSEEQKENSLNNTTAEPELTPEELLKQAKKRKSVAKSNFFFRKRQK